MSPWWSTAPIRVRLTAWYAAVLSLLLVVYATATYVAVRHEFREQLEDELRGNVSDHAHDAEARVEKHRPSATVEADINDWNAQNVGGEQHQPCCA